MPNSNKTTEPKLIRIPVGSSLADAEKELILATLEDCRGNKSSAAKVLGISLKTLYNRLHAYAATDQTPQG